MGSRLASRLAPAVQRALNGALHICFPIQKAERAERRYADEMIPEADLIRASNGEPWTRVHRRVWDAPGAIVDLGAIGWDWTERFITAGRRVVGVDPFLDEAPPSPNVSVFRGVVTCVRGQIQITQDGHASTTRGSGHTATVESTTLVDLLDRYGVTDVAALKMNVEGSEYEILISMPEEMLRRVDQIAVSFHDFVGHGSYRATAAVILVPEPLVRRRADRRALELVPVPAEASDQVTRPTQAHSSSSRNRDGSHERTSPQTRRVLEWVR